MDIIQTHNDEVNFDVGVTVITVRHAAGVFTLIAFSDPAHDLIVYPGGEIFPVNYRIMLHADICQLIAETV